MNRKLIEQGVKLILSGIEDKSNNRSVLPISKELSETPRRVASAYAEMMNGYEVDIDLLFKTFEGGSDQVVIVNNIEFHSTCLHHLLPFSGVVHVGYLPKDRVIGASKIPRLVEAMSHRLQLQERMTEQVAKTLQEKLDPKGVAVIVIGKHSCMRCRGIKNSTAGLTTSIMLGAFRDDATLRAEFLNLLRCSEG